MRVCIFLIIYNLGVNFMSYIKNFCTLITEILNVCQTRISIYRNLNVVKSLSRVCMLKYNRDISRPGRRIDLDPAPLVN